VVPSPLPRSRVLDRRSRSVFGLIALAVSVLAGCSLRLREALPGDARQRPAHGAHDATARHSFENVEHWVAVFDDPARDAWQKPREVVEALEVRPRMTVADIGAGTGYFSRHLARAVGEHGTVLASEPEPNLVAHLRKRAEHEGTANLVPILASPDNPRLPAGVDLILIVNTIHHIDDRIEYLRRLRKVLAATGRVAVIDFKKEKLPVGPPPDHKLAREHVIAEFEKAGYTLAAEPTILPYQYFLIFRPR
jgi:ubiquinone/menaquinone biosynthesis C-methylase UbiE